MNELRVCELDELQDPGSIEVECSWRGEPFSIAVIRMKGQVYAYVNRCPHTGAPLNWLPDQFLDYSGTLIQCSLHGAQFRPEDGYCTWGPCQGRSLEVIPVQIRERQVYVTCPEMTT